MILEKEVPFEKLNFDYRKEPEMIASSRNLLARLGRRRTVRSFSKKPVPREVVKNCIMAASSSPSGANKQPYHFAVVENQKIKNKIREAAEKEEELFYKQRASQEWLEDLKPFKTNSSKPYLSNAPYIIVIFAKLFDHIEGKKQKYYYPIESTGIATGTLISCLHMSGLGTLTHTPSPINFVNEILDQPRYYKPMLLLVTGYPGLDSKVPKIFRKSFEKIARFI